MKKNIPIVHVTSYYPPSLGGQQKNIESIVNGLANRGYNVEVLTSASDVPNDFSAPINHHLPVYYFKSITLAHTPIFPGLLVYLLRKPRKFIIHLHVSQAYTPEIVWLVSKVRKIPYVAHIRLDVGKSGLFGFLLLPYKKFFLKIVLKDANKIIVLTPDYKDLVMEKYKIQEDKIEIIPNATNFKVVNNKLSNKVKNLIFVGKLSKQKNLPLLIDSFEMVKRSFPNLVLLIVGDGPEKNNLVDLVRQKKLEKKVLFLGRLDGEKLRQAYLKADIFVLTSNEESFGTVLIEAMACGLPIVSREITAVRNVVLNDKTGILTESNSEAIAKAIEKLIRNPKLRQKLTKNGLREVKKYSWKKIVTQIEGIYKNVIY